MISFAIASATKLISMGLFTLTTITDADAQCEWALSCKVYVFYLVGLHFLPHFDFGYSKKKNQSATKYYLWINLV